MTSLLNPGDGVPVRDISKWLEENDKLLGQSRKGKVKNARPRRGLKKNKKKKGTSKK